MTLARRIAPEDAEDLVSDSFTAVLHTITVSRKGPVDGFRSYLFATMRNRALRLQKETSNVRVTSPEEMEDLAPSEEQIDVVRTEESAAVVRAFHSLPERWRKVLWLSEVEDEPRSEVAAELGLGLNATSALHRRARQGLQLEWLNELLPVAMREDPNHVAKLLPKALIGKLDIKNKARVEKHLRTCPKCAETNHELRDACSRMGHHTLGTLGFGALGAVLMGSTYRMGTGVAVAATLSEAGSGVAGASGANATGTAISGATSVGTSVGTATTIGSGATAAVGALKLISIAAGALLLVETVGGATNLMDTTIANSSSAETSASEADPTLITPTVATEPSTAQKPDRSDTSNSEVDEANDHQLAENVLGAEPVGQFSGDDWVPYLDVTSTGGATFVPPTPPVLVPRDDVELPPEIEMDSALLAAPELFTQPNQREHIAPVLAGTAQPLSTVVVEVREPQLTTPTDAVYLVSADEAGTWSVDLSTLGLEAGQIETRIWQMKDWQISRPLQTNFFLEAPGLTLLDYTALDASTAGERGIPVDFNGPANATMCMVTDTDQQFEVPVNGNGVARRFLRFAGEGTYDLRFMWCDGNRYGPIHRTTVEIMNEGVPGREGFDLGSESREVFVDEE